jgi:hypothetical protein
MEGFFFIAKRASKARVASENFTDCRLGSFAYTLVRNDL